MNLLPMVLMFLGEHMCEWVCVLCTHSFHPCGLVDIPGLEKIQGHRDHSPARKNSPALLSLANIQRAFFKALGYSHFPR